MQELPFVQVRATSRQVIVGPYGVLLAASAQVAAGFVQLRRRDEAQSSSVRCPPGDTSAGVLDSGAVNAVMPRSGRSTALPG